MTPSEQYIQELEKKIEQQEQELAKIQIFEDYTTEILNLAADGFEKAKIGCKTCNDRDFMRKGQYKGEMVAYEQILLLVKKWLRELE